MNTNKEIMVVSNTSHVIGEDIQYKMSSVDDLESLGLSNRLISASESILREFSKFLKSKKKFTSLIKEHFMDRIALYDDPYNVNMVHISMEDEESELPEILRYFDDDNKLDDIDLQIISRLFVRLIYHLCRHDEEIYFVCTMDRCYPVLMSNKYLSPEYMSDGDLIHLDDGFLETDEFKIGCERFQTRINELDYIFDTMLEIYLAPNTEVYDEIQDKREEADFYLEPMEYIEHNQ